MTHSRFTTKFVLRSEILYGRLLPHMSIFGCVLTRFPWRSHSVLSTLCTFILGSCPRSHHFLCVLTAFTVSAYSVFSTFEKVCRLPCVNIALFCVCTTLLQFSVLGSQPILTAFYSEPSKNVMAPRLF